MSRKKCRIVVTLILSFVVLLVVPLIAEGQVSKPKVEYTVTAQFPLEGGFGRVIYISPTNGNEKDLEFLGDILREDTRNEGNASIAIYDDEKAARMSERSDLSDQEWAYLTKHEIAAYERVPELGVERLHIYLYDKETIINYRK